VQQRQAGDGIDVYQIVTDVTAHKRHLKACCNDTGPAALLIGVIAVKADLVDGAFGMEIQCVVPQIRQFCLGGAGFEKICESLARHWTSVIEKEPF